MLQRLLKKWNDLPVEVKASIAFFIASVCTQGVAYITTPIYTRILSTDEYGQVSVYFTWMQVFGILAMFCLSNGVFNNGMIDFEEDRDGYSFSMLVLSNVITIIFGVLIVLFYPFLHDYIGIEMPLIVVMLVCFLFQPAYNFWYARQRYEYKYKATLIITMLSAVISSAGAIVAILLNPENRLYGRILGAEVPLIILYIFFYMYLATKSGFKVKTGYWKYALVFNLPLIPHYLSTYLLSSSDKLMISSLVNDSATAYYSVAHSVAAVVIVFWSAVNASLVPYTYRKCKAKDYDSLSKVTLPILVGFAVVCVLLILLAPEVVCVMSTENYQEAIYVIPPIVGGVFFQVHYYMYANVLFYYKKASSVMWGSLAATVCNIILNFFFIREYGYIAAGYTTLICYLIQASIDYIALRKVVKKNVYNMKGIGLLSLALGVIAIFSNMLYGYTLIRYILILIIVGLGFCGRKKIVKIMRTIKE